MLLSPMDSFFLVAAGLTLNAPNFGQEYSRRQLP